MAATDAGHTLVLGDVEKNVENVEEMTMLKFWAKSARALFAGLATAGAALYTAVVENGGSLDGISDATWIGLGVAALTAFGGVWGFVNPK